MEVPARFTIVLSHEDGLLLQKLAAKHDCYWNMKPNATALVRLIARGEIILKDPHLEGKGK